MKKLKFPLFILAIATAIAGTVAAGLPAEKEKTFTVYHYTADVAAIGDLQNMANWRGTEPEDGCSELGEVPCTFTYAGTEQDFQDYLNSKSNPSIIIGDADTRRDP